ncbi:hypothetical protein ACJX0J_036683, partial [Zea mays]
MTLTEIDMDIESKNYMVSERMEEPQYRVQWAHVLSHYIHPVLMIVVMLALKKCLKTWIGTYIIQQQITASNQYDIIPGIYKLHMSATVTATILRDELQANIQQILRDELQANIQQILLSSINNIFSFLHMSEIQFLRTFWFKAIL